MFIAHAMHALSVTSQLIAQCPKRAESRNGLMHPWSDKFDVTECDKCNVTELLKFKISNRIRLKPRS